MAAMAIAILALNTYDSNVTYWITVNLDNMRYAIIDFQSALNRVNTIPYYQL